MCVQYYYAYYCEFYSCLSVFANIGILLYMQGNFYNRLDEWRFILTKINVKTCQVATSKCIYEFKFDKLKSIVSYITYKYYGQFIFIQAKSQCISWHHQQPTVHPIHSCTDSYACTLSIVCASVIYSICKSLGNDLSNHLNKLCCIS